MVLILHNQCCGFYCLSEPLVRTHSKQLTHTLQGLFLHRHSRVSAALRQRGQDLPAQWDHVMFQETHQGLQRDDTTCSLKVTCETAQWTEVEKYILVADQHWFGFETGTCPVPAALISSRLSSSPQPAAGEEPGSLLLHWKCMITQVSQSQSRTLNAHTLKSLTVARTFIM